MTVRYYAHKGIQIEIFYHEWGKCYAAFDKESQGYETADFSLVEKGIDAARKMIDSL